MARKEHTVLTGGADLVDGPVPLRHVVAGDVVAEADRRHGDVAVVERVEVVPVVLDAHEDRRRDEEDEDEEQEQQDRDMDEADVDGTVGVAELLDEPLEQHGGGDHETFHQRREHDEGERDPDRRVHDTEDLAAF